MEILLIQLYYYFQVNPKCKVPRNYQQTKHQIHGQRSVLMEAILRKSRGDVLVKFMDREVFLWKLYLGSHMVTFWSNQVSGWQTTENLRTASS